MKELDIELIRANTPQAKGRVERANGTLQDRLIKLMRLRGISTMEEGNRYLEEFRADFNVRFGKSARDAKDAHRLLSDRLDLDRILVVKEERKVHKCLSVYYNNRCYQLQTNEPRRLMNQKVMLYEGRRGLVIEHNGRALNWVCFEESAASPERSMDRKRLEAFLDRKKPLTGIGRSRQKLSTNF